MTERVEAAHRTDITSHEPLSDHALNFLYEIFGNDPRVDKLSYTQAEEIIEELGRRHLECYTQQHQRYRIDRQVLRMVPFYLRGEPAPVDEIYGGGVQDISAMYQMLARRLRKRLENTDIQYELPVPDNMNYSLNGVSSDKETSDTAILDFSEGGLEIPELLQEPEREHENGSPIELRASRYDLTSQEAFNKVEKLLSQEEEKQLMKEMEVGVFAKEALEALERENGTPVPYISADSIAQYESLDELREDLRFLIKTAERAENRFVRANIGLVIKVAQRRQGALRHMDIDDLRQEMTLGLLMALKKADHTKNLKFSTYAIWWLNRNATRGMAFNNDIIRAPVGAYEMLIKLFVKKRELANILGREPTEDELGRALGKDAAFIEDLYNIRQTISTYSLDEAAQPDLEGDGDALIERRRLVDEANTTESIVLTQAMHRAVRRSIAAISDETMRNVILMHFGFGGEVPKSYSQIAEALNISKSHAHVCQQRALEILRPVLEAYQ